MQAADGSWAVGKPPLLFPACSLAAEQESSGTFAPRETPLRPNWIFHSAQNDRPSFDALSELDAVGALLGYRRSDGSTGTAVTKGVQVPQNFRYIDPRKFSFSVTAGF